MATINQLSAVDSLQGGDQIPVYDASNGDARKSSLTTLASWLEANLPGVDFTSRVVAPAIDGFNVDVGETTQNTWIIINPTAQFSTGSLSLPSGSVSVDNQEVMIVCTNQVNAFAVSSAGATVQGAPTELVEYTAFSFKYNANQNTWYMLDSTGNGAGGNTIINRFDFTGDGVTTAYSLPGVPTALGESVLPFIDGIAQEQSAFSVSTNTVTFSAAPPLNSAIEIVVFDVADIGATTANLVSYTQGGLNAVSRTVQNRLRETISVKDFGAVGDGVTDDTAAIQDAHDYASTIGGTVFYPAGNYLVTRIKVYSGTGMRGDGVSSTVITQIGSTTGALIYNNANTDQFITLRDFTIDGNKAGQSSTNAGIYLDGGGSAPATGDHIHNVDNVVILNTKGHGFQLINGVREVKCRAVHVHGADRRGFSIGSTDCSFEGCTSGNSGEEGWNVGGANNHFVACKAFSAGRLVTSDGFNINADRNEFSACEAQDNGRHGFNISSDRSVLSAIIADSNGLYTAGAIGIVVTGDDNTIQGSCSNRSGKVTQEYGLAYGSTAVNNVFVGSLVGNNTAAWSISATGKNRIEISTSKEITGVDATPDVNGVKYLKMTPGAANTITNLTGGFEGHEVFITFGDANNTVDLSGNPNMRGNGGVDLVATTEDMIKAVKLDGAWRCLVCDAA